MRVRVRFDPECRFDIGERTPEKRSLIKQYVKAFTEYAGTQGGRLPGARQVNDMPPMFAWADANWEFVYIIEQTRRIVTINILSVELTSSGNRF
jgi:hypothetical protein